MFQPTLESPVALYIRRSRDDQSSYSPEAQERIGRQFCAASDLPDPVLYFDDDYSGTSGERPQFLRLKEDAPAAVRDGLAGENRSDGRAAVTPLHAAFGSGR